MKIDELWKQLQPIASSVESLKKDLAEGKVPELPYFIVDQTSAKASISAKIAGLDGERMSTSLVIAPYGNGKTNLLKYLRLFFGDPQYGVNVLYTRADIEQPDVILMLLKVLQDNHTQQLIDAIKEIKATDISPNALANNFEESFAAIREYSDAIFAVDRSDDELKKLIYLGTGRLYSKASFAQFDIAQLTNFNRREVFVFLLNILSHNKLYLIFEIDEIEKISEKSSLRFNQFLTSYRELVDLFNKIKGHYLISCFTLAQGRQNIRSANEAFFTRVEQDIIDLPVISENKDIDSLLKHLNTLFETNRSTDEISKMIVQVQKKQFQINRELVRYASGLLQANVELVSVKETISKNTLEKLYALTYDELELEGMFKGLHQKFFDPLEYYLEDNYLLQNESQLLRQTQTFIDEVNSKSHVFVFNDTADLDTLNKKLNDLILKFGYDLVVYAPDRMELSNSSIRINSATNKVELVDYDPEQLFVLLNMYRDNFEVRKSIGEVISVAVNNNL